MAGQPLHGMESDGLPVVYDCCLALAEIWTFLTLTNSLCHHHQSGYGFLLMPCMKKQWQMMSGCQHQSVLKTSQSKGWFNLQCYEPFSRDLRTVCLRQRSQLNLYAIRSATCVTSVMRHVLLDGVVNFYNIMKYFID